MKTLSAFVLALSLPIASPAAAEALCDGAAEAQQTAVASNDRRPNATGERRIKWWLDEKSRAELGITDQQSAEIEEIFQSSLPALRQARRELDEFETKLSQLIKEGTAPVPVITEQVERVENALAEMNKRRTVMLYRINRVLSAEQRAKLKAWHEREEARRSGDGRGRH